MGSLFQERVVGLKARVALVPRASLSHLWGWW